MQWVKKDLLQYIQAKEYVDTMIVPLSPFHISGDENLATSAFKGEVLSILTNEIEKELTGRILLTPSYNYLKNGDKQHEVTRLNEWMEDGSTQPFINIFFITFDSTWKKHEQSLKGTLLWLPGIQSGDLSSTEMHGVIHDQVGQISELIKSYWNE